MNPGEHRNPEPGSSGRLPPPAELSAQGSATTPARRGESISQAGGPSQITGSGTRCKRPKRVALSKERSQPLGGQHPAGQRSSRRSGARTLDKPMRGFGRASAEPLRGGIPSRSENQEGSGLTAWFTPIGQVFESSQRAKP